MQRKLTIGILTCDDFDGLYFTIQALRLFHPETAGELEFLVLDNRPDGKQGAAVKRFTAWVKEPIRYVPITDAQGTALRDRLFALANTPYVICLDSHVLLAPGALRKLIDFFDAGKDEDGLLQGPLFYDDVCNVATHFDPVWRASMWGIWACDPRGANEHGEPFEIPAQGLGVFANSRVRFVRGTARYRTWRELERRALDWASRSLKREFEEVIMVEVMIEEMYGSD